MTRVLFLEDEPTIADVTLEYMKMQDYLVDHVADGNAAIEALNHNHYDIAVLDIMVPEKSGLEVLEYIKKEYPEILTIMLTALADEQTQIKAFNLYADDYVIKPFSPIVLLKRIEAILRRGKQSDVIAERGLVIDELSYQAYYDGENLQLTLTEFLLLQTLNNQPKRVFSRELLLERIFPDDYFANDRIIDAHIKNLRKKLPYNFIKTITGIGYQFQSEV